jgi:7-keto-8-aminopelargonate synthetase-like enzyme
VNHAQTYNHVCHDSVNQTGMGTTASRDTEPRRKIVEPPSPRGAKPTKVEILHDIAKRLRRAEVTQLTVEDEAIDGRLITIGRRRVVNFGSCSYLGLETDRRLVEGAQQATAKYGTVFSTSRAYLSAPPYTRLTALLSQIAGGRPVAIGSSTTLLHAAALPVVVAPGDTVAYDAEVHPSIQAMLPTLAALGARCAAVPHQGLAHVEAIAAVNPGRTFYLADGVYGMHGDTLPLDALWSTLERNPRLWAYVDDTHGAGWTGRDGAGWVLGQRPLHDRMFVVIGMSKALAAGGGFIACPTPELADAIVSVGGPSIFSGPMQPPLLGAAVAAAELLLSDELAPLQARLGEWIRYFDAECRRHGLVGVIPSATPIKFLQVGSAQRATAICRRVLDDGFFTNVAIFPTVGVDAAGVRVLLNLHQTPHDITRLVRSLRDAAVH